MNVILEGFDVLKQITGLNYVHDSFSASTPPTFPIGRTGSGSCMQIEAAERNFITGTSPNAEIWCLGIGYYADNIAPGVFSSNGFTLFDLMDGATTQVRLRTLPPTNTADNNTVQLILDNGAKSSPNVLWQQTDRITVGAGVWNYIELYVRVNQDTGLSEARIYVNQVLKGTVTGLNLAPSGSNQANLVEIGAGYSAGNPAPIIRIDDVYAINDYTGTPGLDASVTDVLGPVAIEGIEVEANHVNAWDNNQANPGDPSDPSINWQQHLDFGVGIDFSTTFVLTDSTTPEETYEMSNIVEGHVSNSILGIELVLLATKGTTGDNRTIQFLYRDGNSNLAPLANTVTVSQVLVYQVYKNWYGGNPLNSNNPWTPAQIDNARFGFKLNT